MSRSTKPTNDSAASAALFQKLAAIVASNKKLATPIAWVRDGRNLRFIVALDIDGVTQEGVVLFGRASVDQPDRHVSLGLSCYDVAGQHRNFDRLDWRPLDAHNNKGLGPPEFCFLTLDGTHHHTLGHNAALPMGLLRALGENLPAALPVEPEPNWPAFVALAGERWNIEDLDRCPLPLWQYPLALSTGPDRV